MGPDVVTNFGKSLLIMWQGMQGIFVVIALIGFIVWGLSKIK